jgi:DNA-binding NtrC family response regulator
MQSSILVFETSPAWTPELQRQFHSETARVQQCTRPIDVLERVSARDRTVVVLQFDSHRADCMQLLASLFDLQQRVSSIVIGSPQSAELEGPVKELGATVFLAERPTGRRLANACRRQLQCG